MKTTLKALLPLCALALGTLASADAGAQMVCGEREDIVAQLKNKYGETRRSVGLQQGRGIVEVFANGDSGSWTILVTNPQGKTCLMAAGEAFQIEDLTTADTPA